MDLDIVNKGVPNRPLNLLGTIYVNGNLRIGSTDRPFKLYLNNQTIFVNGSLDIGVQTNIYGSGVIIARGDIFFLPMMHSEPSDFVLVMSLEGFAWISPLGDFYGSVAGNTQVDVQPNTDILWYDPTDTDLHFPTGQEAGLTIKTWEIVHS